MSWPVHNERKSKGLTALLAVVGTYPDIVIRVGFTALVDLIENRRRVFHVEHWQPPHFPVGIAGVWIVSELYVDRPIVVQAIFCLQANLVVSQRRQEGKGSLGQMKSHTRNSLGDPCSRLYG